MPTILDIHIKVGRNGASMANTDICAINKFVERDIDMLLAEELRVSPSFGKWVMAKFGVADTLIYPATSSNVSVVEDGSEADVIATFATADGSLHRLFVENKIDAMLMPEQLERYVRRGDGELRRGLVKAFSVLFFTPSNYRSPNLPINVEQISFEQAADFLQSEKDLRSHYRASLLLKALPLRNSIERDARVMESDPYIKEWWDKVYGMLEREFPGFFIHKTHYPRSVYFAPETPGQARYLRLDFKGHKGEIDLAFKNVPVEMLRSQLLNAGAAPGNLVANGKSSAIQIAGLQPFVISDGFGIIDTKVLEAYRAAHKLLTFWQLNRAHFEPDIP
jgi:hypothetical protein